jgi:hypothetical protein
MTEVPKSCADGKYRDKKTIVYDGYKRYKKDKKYGGSYPALRL